MTTRILKSIPWLAFIATNLIAVAALAQEAATPALAAVAPVADAADTFATVYLVGGGFLMMGIGWLITWGVGKLKGSYAKETAGRFLGIFNTGLQGAHAKFKMELESARSADSDGGAVITDKEWDAIRTHMWEYLKTTYGSMASITAVVGAFTGTKGEDAAKDFIDNKIDAGIAEMERKDKAAGASGPA
jgi:hypothetical protein